ncbi:hypothetical protein E4T66_18135 [Sinimarinibacterium sp. CAU 1509]|uniref:DUF6471 domain-containing protein n=1 Tax=Sinimarinibacterium sp. CAU 1509 TaxID=2562283 RepID=UPI0010AD0EFC|nr:DUF6471 domain-containing protein [Sinimarinibacterium sp. CAU 1509]TJY57325.1 hypothetical protein E4T66_18135 [Sinimarinibacterium sp. CAU 1509]
MGSKQHRELVASTLRAEKARAGATFGELSERLKACGIQQSGNNLKSKFARGQMDAGLFLAILDALGVRTLDLPDLLKDIEPRRNQNR